ncbi:MAG: response regulator [Planctomycetes bacterium]|nr:response regulator [Planctomycetota bacterium]
MPGPQPRDLHHELHLQMLLRGNRIGAALLVVAGVVVNLFLRPDPPIAAACLVVALLLLLLTRLARSGRVALAAGGSLALLSLSLSGMYLRGVLHVPILDQALHGAVLLPLVAYSCLIGSGWRWVGGVTVTALGLNLTSFLVWRASGDALVAEHGVVVLIYASLYTLASAAVSLLVTIAHRRVVQVADDEAAAARRRGAELQIAEARLRAILDAIPHPIFAKDVELRYVECNAAFPAVLGQPRAAIIGRTVQELVPGPAGAAFHQRDRDLLAQGPTQSHEAPVRFADGQDHPVSFHKALVVGADGRPAGLVGIMVDLSERRRLEERLSQAEKIEALGRLAGGVAHDVNNQLAGILGYAEMLASRLPDGQDREEALAIATAARRAADLPRQLLAFARKGRYLSVPVDIHRLVEEVVGLLGRSISPAITIRTDCQAGRSLVTGDPGQLQGMILNLGLNARDAMSQGGTLTFATAEAAIPGCSDEVAVGQPPGAYLLLTVSDTGCGMDAETKARLFEPFFTTKAPGQGTGLGLASVFGAVQNHRGSISVQSWPGQGTRFAILLPLAEQAGAVAPSPCQSPPRVPPRRILVVDDDATVRAVLCAQLAALGHHPRPCASGAEALAAMAEGQAFDLAVIDLLMPGMPGRELFHRLRAIRPDLPVIIASGHHDDQEAQGLLDAGAQAFLPKPHGIQDLVREVGRAVGGSDAR